MERLSQPRLFRITFSANAPVEKKRPETEREDVSEIADMSLARSKEKIQF